ncbi:hypothetical protein DERF_000209 [Dermatophagoides farinae]|uniref:Tetraspanin n=2 Tax=Dermatophagoides farinae TaxID=6954 RepID=A0A922L9Z2_DERFA|nr:hypothetical protein HUG17_8058 [Dermatophagoides farinae]KAH9526092.1 hypothetical protein DERF_000209 [Dermatophagoides farinae]
MEFNPDDEAICAKRFLFLFNIIFWISSIIIFIFGVYYLVQDELASLFLLFFAPRNNLALLQLLAWILVFLGTLTFLMALCGCFTAMENNRCLLFIYTFLLMLTFSLEMTIGMLAVIFKERIFSRQSTIDFVLLLQNEYGIHSSFTAAVDLAQTKFECCGIESPADYQHSRWLQKQIENRLPDGILIVSRTCCKLANRMEKNSHLNPKPINETMCQSDNDDENRPFRNQKGCMQLVDEFIRSECKMFIGLGVGLAGFSFIGILASICFCRSVHSTPRLKRTRKTPITRGHGFH